MYLFEIFISKCTCCLIKEICILRLDKINIIINAYYNFHVYGESHNNAI